MWNVDSSDEYDAWFLTLDEKCKEAVLQRVLLLQQYGPNLSRPYADVLHGSKKLSNLKELRNQTQKHLLRVAYSITLILLEMHFCLLAETRKVKTVISFTKI